MMDWLRKLMGLPIPGQPFQRSARDQAIIDQSRAEHDAFRKTYVPPTEMSPHTQRIHDAALDKDFPEKRKVAVKRINESMKSALLPAGFSQNKSIFTRDIGGKNGIIRLERSRYGFEAMITVEVEGPPPLFGAKRPGPVRLHDFLRKEELPPLSEGGSGWIEYSQVFQDAAAIDPHMKLLMERALPWMLAHATNPAPDIAQYRKSV